MREPVLRLLPVYGELHHNPGAESRCAASQTVVSYCGCFWWTDIMEV